ncbi:MAG: hypothetical protein J6D21_06685 [Clostridia bacterium]|nr:hypothetical protein [Clostridia bacterium]
MIYLLSITVVMQPLPAFGGGNRARIKASTWRAAGNGSKDPADLIKTKAEFIHSIPGILRDSFIIRFTVPQKRSLGYSPTGLSEIP